MSAVTSPADAASPARARLGLPDCCKQPWKPQTLTRNHEPSCEGRRRDELGGAAERRAPRLRVSKSRHYAAEVERGVRSVKRVVPAALTVVEGVPAAVPDPLPLDRCARPSHANTAGRVGP